MSKPVASLNKLDDNTIMIVDALNLAFRYKHSKAKNFTDDYLRTVDSLRKSYKAGKVIITCDSGSSEYRKNIYPDYKKTRKDRYEGQTEQEKLDFEEFFSEFNKIMEIYQEIDDYPLFRFSKCEADDIAAYIVKKRKNKNKIWLISTDKDWDLLIAEQVSRFSYVTRKEITYNNWKEHYPYACEDHISIMCLTGDTKPSGDNIPGVVGIGPKKAQELVEIYGTAMDIAYSLPINSKYKHIINLNEFGKDNLLRNYRLMDLLTYCEDALGEDNCKMINSKLESYVH